MKKVFNKIWSLVWNPEFFQNLDGIPIWPAIKRLISFIFVASFLFSLVVALGVIPFFLDLTEKFEQYVFTNYPEGLVITFENGQARTEEARRYELKASDFFRYFNSDITEMDLKKIKIDNILVIDTVKDDWTLADWKEVNASLILTKDSIISIDRNTFKVDPLSFAKEKFILDYEKAIIFTSKFIQILRVVLPFLGVLAFLMFFLANIIGYLIVSLFIAFIIWSASKVGQDKKNFRTAWEISLYGMCLPALLAITCSALLSMEFLLVTLAVLLIWLFNSRYDTHTLMVTNKENTDK